jgi:N-alpha-acetyltransferase 38, NatC auxiliary subunit
MESLSTSHDQPDTPEQSAAKAWLKTLLNKNLRIHATDGRLFVGQFKCTDPVSVILREAVAHARLTDTVLENGNIVISFCHEYRQPSQQQIMEAAARRSDATTVSADMSSRYLGLVVVPGEFITKLEVEEFVSQLPNRSIQQGSQ